MLAEVERIKEFRRYQARHPRAAAHYAAHWSGVCLTSTDGGVFTDLSEILDHERATKKQQLTAVGELCPYMMDIAQELGAIGSRVRVMRIGPTGSLFWHSHVRNHGQPPEWLTVHVPIIVPPSFRWSVIDYNVFEHGAMGAEHAMRYEPGQAMVFNSYHYHNVFNDDPSQHRVSLMLYVNLKHVRPMLEAAVENYTGPILTMP